MRILPMYIYVCVCAKSSTYVSFHLSFGKKSEPQLRQGVDLLTDGYIHNLLTDGGFMYAVRQLLRLKESALAYFALPCNSFTFMAQGTHDRTVWQPFGCLWFAFVQCGNILGARTVLLIMLAACRSVQYFVENPENSCVRFFPLSGACDGDQRTHAQPDQMVGPSILLQWYIPMIPHGSKYRAVPNNRLNFLREYLL